MTTRIGIAGDWHGSKEWALARVEDFHDAQILTILHLGDFGIWHDEEGQDYLFSLNALLESFGMKIRVTLGNHENYVMVSALVTITEGDDAGWQFSPELPNILYATRGLRWEWEGVSFVSLGGANSIDRFGRVEGMNWWAEEQIGYGDIMRTTMGGHAEIMVTHDCPEGVPLFGSHRTSDDEWSIEAMAYGSHSRDDLRVAVDVVKPELLFHGHYHHYLDLNTELVDAEGESYMLHTIGLDKDGEANNIGILELPSKKFTILDY